MAQGHQLHLRLFLEGIEVPVISAAISMAANTPATATIQIIATDKVLDLFPRTVIHLFFYDYIGFDTEPSVMGGDEYSDWFNSRYKLLFMGELQQIQFMKTTSSRAVILQCVDFSNYWDTTYQYNFNGSLFGGRRQAAFIGANSNFFTSPLGHGIGTISRLLSGKSVNFPELKGLLAGVVRMLEAIGGSYYGRNVFRGCSDFTSIAELRLKILQQITAAEQDDSTAKLFARKAFNMWMNRQVQSLGRLVTFRGLLKILFGFIFYEVYPCPAAKFVSAGSRKEKRKHSVPLGNVTKYKGFIDKTNIALNLVIIATDSLEAWKNGSSVQEPNFVENITTTYIKSWLTANTAVNELFAQGIAIGAPAAKDLSNAQHDMKKIKNLSVNNGTLLTTKWFLTKKGSMQKIDSNYSEIFQLYDLVQQSLRNILNKKQEQTSTATVQTKTRVNNQIFRPDIFFAPPPRCNVLFPEMYDQLTFSRNYLREVTRMELQTHNEILGNCALFNGRYYAPNVEDVRRGVKLSSRQFASLIMEHELYTGIIPMFENMSEANLFAMRSGKVAQSGAKVSYAQRAVNFQYFKYRFDARTMEASGRFNPMFVPGFPSLIIDKYMDHTKLELSAMPLSELGNVLERTIDEDTTRGELLRDLVSPQYLGVCSALQHTVNQTGGRTNYQFMQARVHRESTEYLGVDKAEVWKSIGTGKKTSVVAVLKTSPWVKGKRGPYGGIVVNTPKDVSKQYKGQRLTMPGENGKLIIGDKYPAYLFHCLRHAMSKKELESTEIEIAAFEVTENYTHRVKKEVDLPMEEAICPPWIWDGWRVPKISETYDQFFGTTAITDIAGFSAGVDTFYIGADDQAAISAQKATTKAGREKLTPAAGVDLRSKNITEAGKNQVAVLNQDKERTVETSIDFLIRAYSFVKLNNLDVGDFLRAYASRPIATILDILGSADLQIKQVETKQKKIVKKRYLRSKAREATYTDLQGVTHTVERSKAQYGFKYIKQEVTKISYESEGTEGFHSRAFGDVEDLFGLVSPTVNRVLKLDSNRRKVAARLDVRKRRREVVRSYVAELTNSRGLIG